jgi:hypothetical protein
MPVVLPHGGTISVKFDPANPAVNIGAGSINVYLGATAGTIAANIGKVDGTVAVFFSPANPAVNIGAVSLNVYLGATAGTIAADVVKIAGTAAVFFSPSRPTVISDAGTGTFRIGDIPGTTAVYFSPANPAVSATFSGSIAAVPTTGSGDPIYEEIGNWQRVLIAGSQTAASLQIVGITQSINVYLGATAGTIRVGDIPGTTAVYFSPANPAVSATFSGSIAAVPTTGSGDPIYEEPGNWQRILIAGSQSAASLVIKDITSTGLIPVTASGTANTAGGSGANTIKSPIAGRNIKVYAYALTTTGVVSISPRFTTGGSAGATELWRVALQAPASVGTGANLAVQPPGYLFATGTGNTLALYLDSATLVHYSVAYFLESA